MKKKRLLSAILSVAIIVTSAIPVNAGISGGNVIGPSYESPWFLKFDYDTKEFIGYDDVPIFSSNVGRITYDENGNEKFEDDGLSREELKNQNFYIRHIFKLTDAKETLPSKTKGIIHEYSSDNVKKVKSLIEGYTLDKRKSGTEYIFYSLGLNNGEAELLDCWFEPNDFIQVINKGEITRDELSYITKNIKSIHNWNTGTSPILVPTEANFYFKTSWDDLTDSQKEAVYDKYYRIKGYKGLSDYSLNPRNSGYGFYTDVETSDVGTITMLNDLGLDYSNLRNSNSDSGNGFNKVIGSTGFPLADEGSNEIPMMGDCYPPGCTRGQEDNTWNCEATQGWSPIANPLYPDTILKESMALPGYENPLTYPLVKVANASIIDSAFDTDLDGNEVCVIMRNYPVTQTYMAKYGIGSYPYIATGVQLINSNNELIKFSDNDYAVRVYNKKQNNRLIKVDNENNRLKGATFKLYKRYVEPDKDLYDNQYAVFYNNIELSMPFKEKVQKEKFVATHKEDDWVVYEPMKDDDYLSDWSLEIREGAIKFVNEIKKYAKKNYKEVPIEEGSIYRGVFLQESSNLYTPTVKSILKGYIDNNAGTPQKVNEAHVYLRGLLESPIKDRSYNCAYGDSGITFVKSKEDSYDDYLHVVSPVNIFRKGETPEYTSSTIIYPINYSLNGYLGKETSRLSWLFYGWSQGIYNNKDYWRTPHVELAPANMGKINEDVNHHNDYLKDPSGYRYPFLQLPWDFSEDIQKELTRSAYKSGKIPILKYDGIDEVQLKDGTKYLRIKVKVESSETDLYAKEEIENELKHSTVDEIIESQVSKLTAYAKTLSLDDFFINEEDNKKPTVLSSGMNDYSALAYKQYCKDVDEYMSAVSKYNNDEYTVYQGVYRYPFSNLMYFDKSMYTENIDKEIKNYLDSQRKPLELISDENGEIKLPPLEDGIYFLKEVKAPDDYNGKSYNVDPDKTYDFAILNGTLQRFANSEIVEDEEGFKIYNSFVRNELPKDPEDIKKTGSHFPTLGGGHSSFNNVSSIPNTKTEQSKTEKPKEEIKQDKPKEPEVPDKSDKPKVEKDKPQKVKTKVPPEPLNEESSNTTVTTSRKPSANRTTINNTSKQSNKQKVANIHDSKVPNKLFYIKDGKLVDRHGNIVDEDMPNYNIYFAQAKKANRYYKDIPKVGDITLSIIPYVTAGVCLVLIVVARKKKYRN